MASAEPVMMISDAAMPATAAVQAQPRSWSPIIWISSITQASITRLVFAISMVEETKAAPGLTSRSSPVIRLHIWPRVSTASWPSSASRRSGAR